MWPVVGIDRSVGAEGSHAGRVGFGWERRSLEDSSLVIASASNTGCERARFILKD